MLAPVDLLLRFTTIGCVGQTAATRHRSGGGRGESRRAADREDNQNLMLRNVRGQLTRSVEALEQARRRAVSFCQGLFFGQGFYFLLSGITVF